MNLSNELMAFRTAYLKCIAKSWQDEKLENELISFAGESKNILNHPTFKASLPRTTELNWSVDVAVVNNKSVSYNPVDKKSNNGWKGSADLFVIHVPENPFKHQRNSAKESVALASYYEIFTTLFGNGSCFPKGNGSMKTTDEVQSLFKDFEYDSEKLEKALKENMDYGMGVGGAESFLAFGASMLDTISNCWEDEKYFEGLISSMIEPLGEENSSIASGLTIGFKNPWGFRILFEKDSKAQWNENTETWEGLQHNQLYLQYPSKPTEGIANTQALARYNATGPAFPLSCI